MNEPAHPAAPHAGAVRGSRSFRHIEGFRERVQPVDALNRDEYRQYLEALRLQIGKDTAVPSALYFQQLNKASRLIEALALFESDLPDARPVILTLNQAVKAFYSENGSRGPAQQLILQDLKKLEDLSPVD